MVVVYGRAAVELRRRAFVQGESRRFFGVAETLLGRRRGGSGRGERVQNIPCAGVVKDGQGKASSRA